jgi:hypothetical protein
VPRFEPASLGLIIIHIANSAMPLLKACIKYTKASSLSISKGKTKALSVWLRLQ